MVHEASLPSMRAATDSPMVARKTMAMNMDKTCTIQHHVLEELKILQISSEQDGSAGDS